MSMIVNFLTIVNRDFLQRGKIVKPVRKGAAFSVILTKKTYATPSLSALPLYMAARRSAILSQKSATLSLPYRSSFSVILALSRRAVSASSK